MRHQLACFGAGRAEAHPVHDVVQARFQQLEQVLAGIALAAVGLGKVAAELALEHAVDTLDLLLFTQLGTVVGGTGARGTAVLARLAVQLALVGERAARALQEQVGAFTAGKFGLRAGITCHFIFLTDSIAAPGSTRRESACCIRPEGGDGERWAYPTRAAGRLRATR